jgi:hypothetical protein
MGTAENAFAYKKNQATLGTNSCGNGEMSTNVGCQNIDSQIQGDENSVALAGVQTFPEARGAESGTDRLVLITTSRS